MRPTAVSEVAGSRRNPAGVFHHHGSRVATSPSQNAAMVTARHASTDRRRRYGRRNSRGMPATSETAQSMSTGDGLTNRGGPATNASGAFNATLSQRPSTLDSVQNGQ